MKRLFKIIRWIFIERKKSEPENLLIHFLVPNCDRNGKPYPRSVRDNLRKYLEERFDGWSSLGDEPLPGAWRNPESGVEIRLPGMVYKSIMKRVMGETTETK